MNFLHVALQVENSHLPEELYTGQNHRSGALSQMWEKHPGEEPSPSQATTHIYKQRQFCNTKASDWYVLVMLEETGEPRGNPHGRLHVKPTQIEVCIYIDRE